MATKLTERRLVDILIAHFREEHHAGREVRHYEKRIDVVALMGDTGEVWAIEAKVAAWGRAICQAVVNLTASQRSYIAMFAENAHRVPIEQLRATGIGLIAVGSKWGDVQVLVEAAPSQYTNEIVIERLKQRIMEGSGRWK